MKIELDFWADEPEDEDLADEIERVAGLIREDYLEGELVKVGGGSAGWWKRVNL